jgi:hypothetical protein
VDLLTIADWKSTHVGVKTDARATICSCKTPCCANGLSVAIPSFHLRAGLAHKVEKTGGEFSNPCALSGANSLAWNQVLTNAEGNGSGSNES